jgi:ketosteroid isomerase-like protein
MEHSRGLPNMDLKTVTDFTRDFEQLFYQGEVEAMASYYAQDGELIANGHPFYKGKEQITAFWKSTLSATRKIKIYRNIQVAAICNDTNTAYVTGLVRVRYYLLFFPIRKAFRYMTAWKKTEYGWQLAVDISTQVKS